MVALRAEAEHFSYVDSSVLIASVGDEANSVWARAALMNGGLLSSVITRVELARYAQRVGQEGGQLRAIESAVSFVKVDDQAIAGAIAVRGEVKALDALHLGTWARLRAAGLDCVFITADRKQAVAAAKAGATLLHPFGNGLG